MLRGLLGSSPHLAGQDLDQELPWAAAGALLGISHHCFLPALAPRLGVGTALTDLGGRARTWWWSGA